MRARAAPFPCRCRRGVEPIMTDPRGPWAPYRPGRRGPLGPPAGRPPAPPGRLRRHLGRAPPRPERRPRAAVSTASWPARRRPGASPTTSRRTPTSWPTPASGDPATAQGVVGLPHALRPRPAGRAADADVARPLRHQQPQGRRPGAMRRRTRRSAATPAARSASCCEPSSATRRCWSGSTPRRTARGTPTRTSPAS